MEDKLLIGFIGTRVVVTCYFETDFKILSDYQFVLLVTKLLMFGLTKSSMYKSVSKVLSL